MKKEYIVKSNQDFNDIINLANYKKNQDFICYYRDNKKDHARFGISVGKKIGNAVMRNKFKRQVRNIIDENKKYYSNGVDYIIIVRKSCLLLSYQEMKQSLETLLEKIKSTEEI